MNAHTLTKGQSEIFDIKLKLNGDLFAGDCYFVIGVKGETFSATQQFILTLNQDMKVFQLFTTNNLLIFTAIIVVIIYRKEIRKILTAQFAK